MIRGSRDFANSETFGSLLTEGTIETSDPSIIERRALVSWILGSKEFSGLLRALSGCARLTFLVLIPGLYRASGPIFRPDFGGLLFNS